MDQQRRTTTDQIFGQAFGVLHKAYWNNALHDTFFFQKLILSFNVFVSPSVLIHTVGT